VYIQQDPISSDSGSDSDVEDDVHSDEDHAADNFSAQQLMASEKKTTAKLQKLLGQG